MNKIGCGLSSYIYRTFVVAGFVLGAYATCVHSAPTEESLLQAWESLQRQDPKTEVFEKTGDRRYKVKTSRIPYEGELIIASVNMDEDQMGASGMLEVKLPSLKMEELAESGSAFGYSRWMQNNFLRYDTDSQRWMSSKEYSEETIKKEKSWKIRFLSFMSGWGVTLLFLGIILYSLIHGGPVTKKSLSAVDRSMSMSEQNMKLIEKSIKLSESGNELLREIRDLLKAK